MAPIEGRRLVFVAGLHRSGTTPLARALAAGEQVSGFSGTGVPEDEGQHLQDVVPPARAYGGPGRFALDPRSFLDETSPLATPDTARRLLEAWTPHWDTSRPLLLEKSPPNLVRLRFLQALFPGAAFVVVLRHPVVVALGTRKWARTTPLRSLLENWFAAHERFLADAPSIERLHVLRYEDLVARPEAELAAVAAFLGIGAVPASGIEARSERYVAQWDSWARSAFPLRRRVRSVAVTGFAARAARFGYDLEDLTALAPASGVGR